MTFHIPTPSNSSCNEGTFREQAGIDIWPVITGPLNTTPSAGNLSLLIANHITFLDTQWSNYVHRATSQGGNANIPYWSYNGCSWFHYKIMQWTNFLNAMPTPPHPYHHALRSAKIAWATNMLSICQCQGQPAKIASPDVVVMPDKVVIPDVVIPKVIVNGDIKKTKPVSDKTLLDNKYKK